MATLPGNSNPSDVDSAEPEQPNSLSELRRQAAKKSNSSRRPSKNRRDSTSASPPLPAMSSYTGWGGNSKRVRFDAGLFRNVGDVALGGIIFLAPLVLGGRHPIGRLVYILLVTLLMASWVGERFCKSAKRWKFTGIEWLLLAGAGLLIVQSIPLSADLLAKISPAQSELVPTWGSSLAAQLRLANWSHVSLTPHATWLALGVYVAHVVLFLTLVQRFQDVEQIPRTLRWIALAAIGMAILALVQRATGTEKYVWIFDHPSRPANNEVTGAFANTNHFAHFLALGIGPLIWWLSRLQPRTAVAAGPTGNRFGGQNSVHEWKHTALLAGIPVVILAGLLSNSRGGIVVMFLATLVSVALLSTLKQINSRAWLALVAGGVLVLASLTFIGHSKIKAELATLTSGSIESLDDSGARRKVWSANWELIQRFPILGTGVGSHLEAYPRFFPYRSQVRFTHAESGYIQVLTETGWVGGGLLLIGILFATLWSLSALRCQDVKLSGAATAIAAMLAVSVVHASVDFPWYLTSCMSFAIIAAAAACCLHQHRLSAAVRQKKTLPFQSARRSTSPQEGPAKSWPLGGLVWIALLLSFSMAHLGPAMGATHWDRYLKLSQNSRRSLHHQLLRGNSRKERADKIASHRQENTRQMAFHLENCLRHHPSHPQANARMASTCIRLFEDAQVDSLNAMGLDQIRDAAVASNFASREKLSEWLDIAIGKPRFFLDKALYHCQKSHRITPVDGRGYVYLSQLAFLEGGGDEEVKQLLTAAEHVRPHDAFILYQKGREADLAGDLESAIVCWRHSFAMSESFRDEIIARLGPALPAPMFINSFEPDEQGIEQLYSYYRRRKMMMEASIAGPLVVKNVQQKADNESGVPAGKLWHRCRSIYRFLGQDQKALECAHQATVVAPNWFDARVMLADEYMAQESYAKAIEQYQWCQKRKPLDPKIRQRINIAQTLVAKQEFAQTHDSGLPPSNSPLSPPAEPAYIPEISRQSDGESTGLRF